MRQYTGDPHHGSIFWHSIFTGCADDAAPARATQASSSASGPLQVNSTASWGGPRPPASVLTTHL